MAGRKLLLCGNGGSAADAQHVASELVVRYKRDRQELPAVALGTDVTLPTAVGNDYSFDQVFTRQTEALAVTGDVLWAFSTSGTSPNHHLLLQPPPSSASSSRLPSPAQPGVGS